MLLLVQRRAAVPFKCTQGRDRHYSYGLMSVENDCHSLGACIAQPIVFGASCSAPCIWLFGPQGTHCRCTLTRNHEDLAIMQVTKTGEALRITTFCKHRLTLPLRLFRYDAAHRFARELIPAREGWRGPILKRRRSLPGNGTAPGPIFELSARG